MKVRPALPIVIAGLTVAASALLLADVSRAGAPAGRYQLGSGTVFDRKTKLTWQQPISVTTYPWGSASTPGTAQSYCAALGADAGTAWRVPTVRELLTLVDFAGAPTTQDDGGPGAKIDLVAFPGTPIDHPFWSSTQAPNATTLAWCVDFSAGYSNSLPPNNAGYVRCVR